MPRLTADLIEDSFQKVNPVREYELCLRGNKIGLIENMGSTLNQFDTIDLTDNDIRRLDGFPLLTKLKSLLLSNNKIQHVGNNLEKFLPNLETVILINNNIEDLAQIDQLSTIKTLRNLSLLRNPVSMLKHYRLYTIYKMPNLRILDFKRVKEKERQEAQKQYKGKKLKKSTEQPKKFIPGGELPASVTTDASGFDSSATKQKNQERQLPSKEDIEAIRMAISRAKSIEEIEQLNAMLRSGIIPKNFKAGGNAVVTPKNTSTNSNSNMVEEEDE